MRLDTIVELEPLDSLFFGDNKGMELNEGGRTLKIPLPWTISGTLLFHYVSTTQRLEDVRIGCEEGGCTSEERGEATVFAFYGPFIAYGGTYWFHPPGDLIAREGAKGETVELQVLKPRRGGSGYASQLPPVLLPVHWEVYGKLIDAESLANYSEGASTIVVPRPPELKEERRLGIHVDDERRTVKLGYIYTSTHVRVPLGLKYCMIAARKDGKDLSFNGLVRLGGEGRVARMTTTKWTPPWLREEKLEAGSIVKVVLLSPAIYRRDGRNVRIPSLEELPGRPQVCELGGEKLVLGGRPVRVSGWDFVARRAKKMYSAVPPGTVYYLKLREDADRLDLTLSFWRLSSYWERGFGSPLVANVGGVGCG